MKKQSDRALRALKPSLITASAAALMMVSQTSCGGLGLGKKGDSDDSAFIEPEEPKKSRGSAFDRARNRNAWIDENIQTTRRDRYAAQNATTFAPAAEQPASSVNQSLDARPTANGDFTLDPDPADFRTSPSPQANSNMAARSPQQEERLQLPTLDSDFPQPGQPPSAAIDPYPGPNPRRVSTQGFEDEGYIPLQPKLPGAEQIEPPRD
jgi:hypothetical protein